MKIVLKESTEEDYSYIKKWFEYPQNNIFFTSEFRNIKEYKKIFYLIALKKKENKYFTIFVEDRPVGFIALINIDYGDKFGQAWYVMGDKSLKGKGLMSQALGLLLKKAKDKFGFHTIHTWVVDDNMSSIKVLENNNFNRIGMQRESYYSKGEYKDRILFEKIL